MKRTKGLEATAYHEAGHAVAAFFLNAKVYVASIEPENDSAGHVWSQKLVNHSIEYDLSDRNRLRVERKIMILMAGHEAQKMFRPSSIRSYHRRSDFQTIADLMLRVAPTHEEQAVYSRLLRIRTRNLLKGNWHCVRAVAQALMERRNMKGAEVISVIRQGMDARFASLTGRQRKSPSQKSAKAVPSTAPHG